MPHDSHVISFMYILRPAGVPFQSFGIHITDLHGKHITTETQHEARERHIQDILTDLLLHTFVASHSFHGLAHRLVLREEVDHLTHGPGATPGCSWTAWTQWSSSINTVKSLGQLGKGWDMANGTTPDLNSPVTFRFAKPFIAGGSYCFMVGISFLALLSKSLRNNRVSEWLNQRSSNKSASLEISTLV